MTKDKHRKLTKQGKRGVSHDRNTPQSDLAEPCPAVLRRYYEFMLPGKVSIPAPVCSTLGRGGRRSGFSRLEIIGGLIYVALLAALAGPRVFSRVVEARGTASRTQMQLIATALDNYRLNVGRYPTTEQGLGALRERPTKAPVATGWRGPYVQKGIPVDPWGHAYLYLSPGVRNTTAFDLSTLGRDGKLGGDGEDTDLIDR